MKRYLILFALICSLSTLEVYAQADARTLTTKIADLLARVPFNNAAQSEKNMQAIAEMGEDGLQEMMDNWGLLFIQISVGDKYL